MSAALRRLAVCLACPRVRRVERRRVGCVLVEGCRPCALARRIAEGRGCPERRWEADDGPGRGGCGCDGANGGFGIGPA